MLSRPLKPISGIKKLNFRLDPVNLVGFREFVSLLTDDHWSDWDFRQTRGDVHKETQTIRLLWLDLLIKHYTYADSIKFDLLDEATKYLSNLFIFLENYYSGSVCRVILTKQNPHSTIPIHVDKGFSLTHTHRIHVPIFSNNSVVFCCGSDNLNMEIGLVYEINNQLNHCVNNYSDDYKIHLIIDVIESRIIEKPLLDNDPLFVHIPKTGGTSIANALHKNGLDRWHRDPAYKNHDPLFLLETNNKIDNTVFKFSVVRNPFSRTYSYYHHFKRINEVEMSFLEFLNMLRHKILVSNKTPLILFNQSFYLFDNTGVMSLDKIYKFENLFDWECDFNTHLNNLNVGSYSREQYYVDYTYQAQNLVRHICCEDFINFEYPLEFE